VRIDVLANDSNPDEDPTTVSDYTSATAQGGTADCATAGACTYTPLLGFGWRFSAFTIPLPAAPALKDVG
jgi:hypothetical protein